MRPRQPRAHSYNLHDGLIGAQSRKLEFALTCNVTALVGVPLAARAVAAVGCTVGASRAPTSHAASPASCQSHTHTNDTPCCTALYVLVRSGVFPVAPPWAGSWLSSTPGERQRCLMPCSICILKRYIVHAPADIMQALHEAHAMMAVNVQ